MKKSTKAVICIITSGLAGFFLGALLTEAYATLFCFLFSLAAATASIIDAIEKE